MPDMCSPSSCHHAKIQEASIAIRDGFLALEIHAQYYGSSKVVTDPWKTHNIVRGYRCSGGDLHEN